MSEQIKSTTLPTPDAVISSPAAPVPHHDGSIHTNDEPVLSKDQVERSFNDIAAQRRVDQYLHAQPMHARDPGHD